MLDEKEMRPDLVQLLCQVLCKAFQSRTQPRTLQHLAGMVKDSSFLRTILPFYVTATASESNPFRREQYPQHLDNILALISQVLNIYPTSSLQTASMLANLLGPAIIGLRASGVDVSERTDETLEGVRGLVTHYQHRSREGTLRPDKDSYALLPAAGGGRLGSEDEEEQEDFRTLPIFPTVEEIHQEERPFLRPNLIGRRYASGELYLDTHFRLLREDFVRPLRDGVQQLLRTQLDLGRDDNPLRRARFDDIRVYFNTQVVVPVCTSQGMAYTVHFDTAPLKFVRWQNSKRLIYGSLVCLSCDNFESFLFATVSDSDPKQLQKGLVNLTFSEESRRVLVRIQADQTFLMVETTAYFEAYRHVLQGLQEQEVEELPFQRYIVECNKEVRPPAYLRIEDTYDLSDISKGEHKGTVKPFHSLAPEAWPPMDRLGLDESQMAALQLALTKELAIIQGPPGTGKTYVGLKIAQALLTNQDLWRGHHDKSPMLVVCYTNHALDQFLEGIHKFLKKGIVRVGGRSNSEVLKSFNLREVTRNHAFRSRLPGHLQTAYREIYSVLSGEENHIKMQAMQLACSLKGVLKGRCLQKHIDENHWEKIEVDEDSEEDDGAEDLIEIAEEADMLQAERMLDGLDPDTHRDRAKDEREQEQMLQHVAELTLAMPIQDVDTQGDQREEEWQIQKQQKKKIKNRIKRGLGESTVMTEEQERNTADIWALSKPDRWGLYRLWMSRYRVDLRMKVLESELAYQNAADRLAEVRLRENLIVLKGATVIGMTTTGAARMRRSIQEVGPRVVIVEEAAEVLEAHTITTLNEACQHLILIGDHQQLRPSATVYELARNFSLEVSMFERLVKMEFPYVRLNYQHRMRPDMARLLTPHIYDRLENHPSVLEYENIKGLNTNLFFLEHNQPEEEIRDGKSRQNKHEAMFVVALCRYLLCQDYKPEQITILTTYTGQLYCLRNLMSARIFQGVKVHVVDKYQGEENDIVLLSLVRSNPQGQVGFLNIPNRVCVALSRAKKGLYCIGNMAILSKVKLWSNIRHTLKERNQVGSELTLCCQNHPDRKALVARGDDFQQAPEGGCTQPCEFRLPCGHVCAMVCHPYDAEHKRYLCHKECQRDLCQLKHKCPRLCHQTCPKCTLMVQKTIPACQHPQMVPCHLDPAKFTCQEPCEKTLLCGHPCLSPCGSPCTVDCRAKVPLQLECGHRQEDFCFYERSTREPDCRTPCDHVLQCGHPCTGSCSRCHQGRFHASCSHGCQRVLVCSHGCQDRCRSDCQSCRRPCENRCVHSRCTKPCGQPCAPCVEPCAWQCPHQSCSRLCHEPCDRPPCVQPCQRALPCGHPCIGLCGDKCPDKCRECDREEVTEIFFGDEDEPEARFIQLEDCGHLCESVAMDRWMGSADDAHRGAEQDEPGAIKLKECPRCKTAIRKSLRYGAQVNASLAQIEMVKEKINGLPADIKEKRRGLTRRWLDQEVTLGHIRNQYLIIRDAIRSPYVTLKDLWVLENKVAFLERVNKLLMDGDKKMQPEDRSVFEERVAEFVKWLMDARQIFSLQQFSDLQNELQRLTLWAELNARRKKASERPRGLKLQTHIEAVRKVLDKPGPFTDQDQATVQRALEELDERLQCPGLGVNEEERKMILTAMALPRGHWYKCPAGHVYAIGECGGAMVTSRCPECNATIGGAQHTLATGNQVAPEMDGASHAAWSNANNLLNFDLLHL
ncbi:NFX1-type zinc finger-containing protein 1 [Aplochiton taeniatus]